MHAAGGCADAEFPRLKGPLRRDPLEVSRQLDRWSQLGVPLVVLLAFSIANVISTVQLTSATLATRAELQEGLAEVRRHALVLHEQLRSDIQLLADHIAGLWRR